MNIKKEKRKKKFEMYVFQLDNACTDDVVLIIRPIKDNNESF